MSQTPVFYVAHVTRFPTADAEGVCEKCGVQVYYHEHQRPKDIETHLMCVDCAPSPDAKTSDVAEGARIHKRLCQVAECPCHNMTIDEMVAFIKREVPKRRAV